MAGSIWLGCRPVRKPPVMVPEIAMLQHRDPLNFDKTIGVP
jgi:hypothetical protein